MTAQRLIFAISGLALASELLVAPAHAADAAHPAPKASAISVGAVAPFIPELKLAASTSAEAEAMLDGSIYFAATEEVDLQVQPLVKVKTARGLGQLLATSDLSSDSLPWRVGIAARLVVYGSDENSFIQNSATFRRIKKTAGTRCMAECEKSMTSSQAPVSPTDCDPISAEAAACVAPEAACDTLRYQAIMCSLEAARASSQAQDSKNCGAFQTAHHSKLENWRIYDYEDFCTAGQAVVREGDSTLIPPRVLLPAHAISVGVAFGSDAKTYLDTTDSQNIALVENRRSDVWKIAARATHIFSRWATLEYGTELSREAKDSKKKGRFCEPQGVIVKGSMDTEPLMAGDQEDVPVERCREELLGAPTRGYVFASSAEYGIVGEEGLGWRWSTGPRLQLRFQGDDIAVDSLQWRMPIAIEALSLPKDVSGDVKGVVRLVPYIENAAAKNSQNEDVRDWRFVVAFELLAQRTLFASVAPEL